MRNINELIGIIKGIDFDTVINEKEIVRLQLWVDQNRNLAYTPQEVQLIQLVDEVLQDSYISADEKEVLFLQIELFKKEDEAAHFFELNGIIEGIICDNEVNEKEIHRLKSWMDEYAVYVRGSQSSLLLCQLVDKILEDGIVTQLEQAQLKRALETRINQSVLQQKIESLRASVKARKNIGTDLIDLLDNEEAIGKIHFLAEEQLARSLRTRATSWVRDSELVFISLTLIAMLKYDGNFYDHVQETYSTLYKNYSEQKIEGLIRSVLNKYRDISSEERARIINVVLLNAIVPSGFLAAFFEFIYDIYKLNFKCTLEDDLESEFRFVYEGLKNSLQANDDELKLTVTKKTYKLIKSTKMLIANDDGLDSIIHLSIIIVKVIDKQFWNKSIVVYNPYLKIGFDGWLKTLKTESPTQEKEVGCKLASRWEPHFQLDGCNLYLVPPAHKVKAGYDYKTIRMVLLNGDEEIYSNTMPDIREIIGGFQINSQKIFLSKPLGNLRYQFIVENSVLYDSREKLKRDFIVFDMDGIEIKNNTDYDGTAVICCQDENFECSVFYQSTNYKLVSQAVTRASSFIICGRIFNFSSMIKPGVFGEPYANHYLLDVVSQEKLLVYKEITHLVFECSDCVSCELNINGDSYPLDNFECVITNRAGVNKYVVNLPLEESGIYVVFVYQISVNSKKQLFKFNFVLDTKLEIDELKLNDNQYLVSVETALYEMPIHKDIEVATFSEDFIRFEHNQREYAYLIPFHFDIYRINAQNWRPTSEAIWIGDVTQESVLQIYGTTASELQIYTSTGHLEDEVVSLKHVGVYQEVSIGFLMTYKASCDYIALLFFQNDKRTATIGCFNRCVLTSEEPELVFDSVQKTLSVTPVYDGKGNVEFQIFDTQENLVYQKAQILSGETIVVNELSSFEKYRVSFSEKEKGLSLRKSRLMNESYHIFYAWDDFVGKTFKISEVYFDQFIQGQLVRKQHYFNRSYITIESKCSDGVYLANLFAKTYNGSYYLYRINPVSVEICSDVMDGEIEVAMTKDGDGLFLDFEHHGIKNTLEDNTAVDIFSYILKLDEV